MWLSPTRRVVTVWKDKGGPPPTSAEPGRSSHVEGKGGDFRVRLLSLVNVATDPSQRAWESLEGVHTSQPPGAQSRNEERKEYISRVK